VIAVFMLACAPIHHVGQPPRMITCMQAPWWLSDYSGSHAFYEAGFGPAPRALTLECPRVAIESGSADCLVIMDRVMTDTTIECSDGA